MTPNQGQRATSAASSFLRILLTLFLGVIALFLTYTFLTHLSFPNSPVKAGVFFLIPDLLVISLIIWLWRRRTHEFSFETVGNLPFEGGRQTTLHHGAAASDRSNAVEQRSGFISGRVTAMQQRQEVAGYVPVPRSKAPAYVMVWSFRLERRDPSGNMLPSVAIWGADNPCINER